MSGIFGYISYSEEERNLSKDFERMHRWNIPYGNSSGDICSEDKCEIGCCFERLNDNMDFACKIISSEVSYAAIDAVIYNRDELLNMYSLSKKLSDEELIFSIFEKKGFSAFRNVNGDFSGVIFDKNSNTIFLFRDHLGIRPLYYYSDTNFTAFSTDIRGILALSDVDCKIDPEWVYSEVGDMIFANPEGTEFANIHCVPPACCLSIALSKDKEPIYERKYYWHLGEKKIRFASDAMYVKRMREIITDAVSIRANATGEPIGAEMSGGLDSSVIDILLNRLGKKCIFHSWSVNEDEVPYVSNDERYVIKDICEHESVRCHFSNLYWQFGPECRMRETLSKIGFAVDTNRIFEFGFAFPPHINTFQIGETSNYISKCGGRVVFTGHGGDEGVSHRASLYELVCHREIFHYLACIWGKNRNKKLRLLRTIKQGFSIAINDRKVKRKPFIRAEQMLMLFSEEFLNKRKHDRILPHYFSYEPIKYIKYNGLRNRLDNVALQGAYNGVRYLCPFLDYRVLDFAVSIPRHMFLKNGINRYIFREAFKDILPQSIYNLNAKSTPSESNFPKTSEDDWFTGFCQTRRFYIDSLNRDLWDGILNFEFLDRWVDEGKPDDEAKMFNYDLIVKIRQCLLAQNVIEKSKSI